MAIGVYVAATMSHWFGLVAAAKVVRKINEFNDNDLAVPAGLLLKLAKFLSIAG